MNPETLLQNKIRAGLAPYGLSFRMQSGVFRTDDGRTVKIGVPGMSDLLFINPPNGQACWLEVKTDTGRPSEEQLDFIRVMQSMGCKAGIVRSIEDALELIGVNHANNTDKGV